MQGVGTGFAIQRRFCQPFSPSSMTTMIEDKASTRTANGLRRGGKECRQTFRSDYRDVTSMNDADIAPGGQHRHR
jgi:hypothetical protein